ncbi:hypothetical protein R5R35_004833 [Gryllus longicercus]|uniref:Uncharacterized protein n=1 Tax=Gryllus longicercus TaxID=2509291 RepID=A0AAN9VW00_9ORTH
MEVGDERLAQYDAGGGFLNRITTGDETWCHYEPETKSLSMERRLKNSPTKKKFKTQSSAGKFMCTIFWDRRGVIVMDFLEPGRTIVFRLVYSNSGQTEKSQSSAREENFSLAAPHSSPDHEPTQRNSVQLI